MLTRVRWLPVLASLVLVAALALAVVGVSMDRALILAISGCGLSILATVR